MLVGLLNRHTLTVPAIGRAVVSLIHFTYFLHNMSWTRLGSKKWWQYWPLWILPLLAVITFFGWSRAKHRYDRWSAMRQVRRATDCLAKGDFKRALLDAKSALLVNAMDTEATRIVAKALEGTGAQGAAAAWRSRLDSLDPGNSENVVAWASDALKAGDMVAAERVLGMLKPDAKTSAAYHSTAAMLAMAKRDTATAETHLAEAARLEPNEDIHRLPLATMRLGSKQPELRTSAVEVLTEISSRPPKSVEALRALLADAISREEWTTAGQLAEKLVADPGATFEDKLTRLATLRAMKSPKSTEYLTDLRNSAVSNPDDLYLLFMWMNQHDLALMVAEWAGSLPRNIIGAPPTAAAVADAYVRGSDWKKLRSFVEGQTWADWDYLRRAFRARALERLDEGEKLTVVDVRERTLRVITLH